ncbi:MAG: diguanylate cyclase, partial [Parasporobacterium sp.]|nr:diguanylate cyclase [Parasporobacterium sp.]
MTSLNEALFTSVPTIAVLCNIFLLFTLFTAKKNAATRAFMLLLGAFILWCGGSLFMRLQTAPGIEFWWKISLTGIFLVPYLYYLLAAAYTGRKGSFLKIIYGLATLAMVVLNFFDVFLCNAHMETAGDASTFHYDVTLWAIIPVVVSAVIIITMIVNLRASIVGDEVHWKYLRPLIIGMVIMVAGVLLDVIPFMNTYPNDTLACLINAVFIYYAFCKKRIYSTSQIASEGAVFVLSLIITTVVFKTFGPALEKFLLDTFSGSVEEPKVFISTMAAFLGMFLFILLNKLLKNIFVKELARRDENVHNFSALVSSSLKLNEILARFYQLAKDETNAESIHISMFSRKHNRFEGVTDADNLAQPLTVGADNPLIEKLRKTKAGFFYEDFKRSVSFRSMWEEEKNLFDSINANYVLPFMDDDRVIGFAVFSDKSGKKKYTYEDLKFLESLSGVSAMAIKNARLYSQMETEARQDSLTNVYNRKALISEMEETLPNAANSPCTLILFNLDDFSLYNELYGTEEGDRALISFAGMISATVGNRGMVARYSGKEFAVLLPRCDSLSAKRIAEEVQKKLAYSIENSEDATKKFLTFSAGICTYPYAATHMNQLVSYANMAVFNIKQKSKNDIAIFTA